ncbi:MAG: hypothetical protein WBC85_12110 [Planktotalea sp.]|uniref:hypothetical protein n=1 Tax=Planktotalea sp. TaxID=2029877 RepID=UPI003C7295DC
MILTLSPSVLTAGVCDKARPNWDGIPVTGVGEAIALASAPASLVLFALTLLAIRFRNQWAALVVLILWVGYASLLTMADPTGISVLAQAEGCIGSPTLFITAVTAICIGMIMYTTPKEARKT